MSAFFGSVRTSLKSPGRPQMRSSVFTRPQGLDRGLRLVGFTPRQTRFLVTAALHGGYCLRRHYQAFAGLSHGQQVNDFFETLVRRELARSEPVAPRPATRGRASSRRATAARSR
jgi:hypothetical protein